MKNLKAKRSRQPRPPLRSVLSPRCHKKIDAVFIEFNKRNASLRQIKGSTRLQRRQRRNCDADADDIFDPNTAAILRQTGTDAQQRRSRAARESARL